MDDRHLPQVRDWWDDERHGTFTGGDQDIFVWWMETGGYADRVSVVGHGEPNSRGHYYDSSLSDAFAMHFCGYPDKKIGVVAFAQRFGIGQKLVPEQLLDTFSPGPQPDEAARGLRAPPTGLEVAWSPQAVSQAGPRPVAQPAGRRLGRHYVGNSAGRLVLASSGCRCGSLS